LGAGALAGIAAEPGVEAAEWTAEEQANVKVVNDLIAAFVARDAAKIAALFTDDATFVVGPPGKLPAPRKPDFSRLVENASSVEMKIGETFALGSIVMHDRHDRIISLQRKLVGRWVGVYALRDGKIAQWIDYTLDYNDW
jgi:limonene-1,2-epoxide hydrolase